MKTFESDDEGLIVKRNIRFYSMCEHHLLPFKGKVNIGYVPNREIIGISKSRYVKWKSRKLTIPEELTKSISRGLKKEMKMKGNIVEIEAKHLCEQMGGVEDTESITRTKIETDYFNKNVELSKI